MPDFPFEPASPDERLVLRGQVLCNRSGELTWSMRPAFLTSLRVVALDDRGFVFNHFFSEIAAADIKSTWKGPRLELVLKNGMRTEFTVPGTTNGQVRDGLQPWLNKINEFLAIARHR